MNLPDDFGLPPVRTLAHTASPRPAAGHFAFWKHWAEPVFAQPAALWPVREPDPSDPTATHGFTSIRSGRIGCALLEPPLGTPIRAGLVSAHGYGRPPTLAEDAERWRPLVDRGVAVLLVRLRGYPASQLDAGDLLGSPFGWIAHGLESPANPATGACDWVLAAAVADLVIACRALAERLHGRGPIYLHGESFGGGLAVIAGAQLAGRLHVNRLALALPSLGDWPWRLAHHRRPPAGSIGADVANFLRAHASLEPQIATTLRLFDATVHARAVRCPILCKLAVRDDAVPAPAAAAVFNAAATPPGLKRRFVVHCGHCDCGIADLRRHALFEQTLLRFLDPAVEPFVSLAGL